MTIDTVYISTYRQDLPLTRICVASIRYWHADVPIVLIKDWGGGDFDTSELERLWNVQIFQTPKKYFGWGFAKLEPLFMPQREKFLMLDSDTVLTGPVLSMLERHDSQFMVDDETQPPEDVKRLYFDVQALQAIDPTFRPGGKNFNSGQWVGTSGVLGRDDFAAVVQWSDPPVLKYPKIFMPGDQGVLNYVLEKSEAQGKCTLTRIPLMWWAPRDLSDVDLELLKSSSPYRRIIHWAGCKLYGDQPMPRADILKFFEDYYYSRVSGGTRVRRWRSYRHYAEYLWRKVLRRIRLAK